MTPENTPPAPPGRRAAGQPPLWHLTLMRLRELWRQPATLFWVFGFPIVLSLGLGAAFHERERGPIAIGAVGLAPAVASSLAADGIRVRALGPEEAARELRAGRIALVLAGSGASAAGLEIRYDPTRDEALLARAIVRGAFEAPAESHGAPRLVDRPIQDAGWRYIDFLVPGLLGMNLMTGALWGIGWSLADLRVRKLLKRLRASPMHPHQLLLAVAIARALVVPLEAAAILLFARMAFGSPVAGSLALLALVVAAGCLAFSGIGVLIGSRAESGEVASGLINLVMLPMLVASGVFFSASHFPDAVQPYLRLLPLTAVNDALRAVLLEGAALREIAQPVAVLAAWAAATFAVGLRLFRWS